ncbi:MAG: family 10 glycosylhydrolase [Clostridia bacterium]|nr:family 10 glycosylhydrolase [Clostridia bacterium]
MTKTVKAICVVMGLISILSGLIPSNPRSQVLAKEQEIKGVWAATLYSMDYPQKPTTNAEELKKSADALIQNTKSHGFNTLFLQVRPSGDALYKSEIFPWSQYLTGSENVPPTDNFDPLEYIIKEAHQNGIYIHAWINPYRITASEKDAENLSEKSIAKKFPHLVVKHTDNKLYLNPGEPEAMGLVVDGAVEIAKNYDIDGIHIDDYFYPSSAFPDGETFTKYGGAFVEIGDWRRHNTTKLVKEMRKAIKEVNPDLIFSVSPCGIWANRSSNPYGSDTSGKQAYYDYYADTRLWVKEELVDLIIPQIYWNIGYNLADFETVAKWWDDTVAGTNVSLCIGQGIYKVSDETDSSSPWYGENGETELKNQLKLIKSLENTHGFVQYRLGSVAKNLHFSNFIRDLNTTETKLFTDTLNYPWAEESIERLFRQGIIKGMGDGTFGCGRNVSRADFVVMLVRMTKQNVPFTENFADVTTDKYYYNEIGIAKALGFASGREGNIFDPLGNITREDMATLVWRTLTKTGDLKAESNLDLGKKFVDANEISPYAETAVKVLVKEGFLGGYETGEFKPKGFATRAECAVLLDRINLK